MLGLCFIPGEGCPDGVLYLERDAGIVFYTWRGMPGWCFIPGEGCWDSVLYLERDAWMVFSTWRGMPGWCFIPREGCLDGVLYLERDAWMVFYTWRGMPGWCFIPGEGCPDGVLYLKSRGGHRHLQTGRMLDIDLISEPPHAPPPRCMFTKCGNLCGQRGRKRFIARWGLRMSHICPCTPCPSPQGYRSKVESRHFAHHCWRGMSGWCFIPGEGCLDGVLYLERDAWMVSYTWRGMPGWCFIPEERCLDDGLYLESDARMAFYTWRGMSKLCFIPREE
jgi:hypothetical protein